MKKIAKMCDNVPKIEKYCTMDKLINSATNNFAINILSSYLMKKVRLKKIPVFLSNTDFMIDFF